MKKKVSMIIFLILALALVIYGLSLRSENLLQRKVEQNIEMKKYVEILKDLEEVESGWPSWASKLVKGSKAWRDYNEGVVLFRLGDYEKAKACFQELSKTADPALKARVFYNQGNTLLTEEDFLGAAEMYKKALVIEPDDFQAKTNLEIIRGMQEQEERQMPPAVVKGSKKDLKLLPWKEGEEQGPTPPEDKRW